MRHDPEQLGLSCCAPVVPTRTLPRRGRQGSERCSGAAVGEAVFSAADAVGPSMRPAASGVLVRWETNPTTWQARSPPRASSRRTAVRRRIASSPAVLARRASAAWEAPKIDAEKKEAAVVVRTSHPRGRHDFIDGTTGSVVLGAAAGASRAHGRPDTTWRAGRKFRHMGVRANADNPEDAGAVPQLRRRGISGLPHRSTCSRATASRSSVVHPERRAGHPREGAGRLLAAQTATFAGMFAS